MAHAFYVYVWADDDVTATEHQGAVDTINNHLKPQVDYDLHAYEMDRDFSYDRGDWDWNDIKEDFVPYVEDKWNGAPPDYSCQMVLVSSEGTGVGAGKAWGHTNRWDGPWSSDASGAGVNAAVQQYIDGNFDCDGDSWTAYQNTVIQEALHTVIEADYYPDGSNEHSLGSIYYRNGGNKATPMITWFTKDNCAGNDQVTDNCNATADRDPDGFTTDISSCTEAKTENYFNTYF